METFENANKAYSKGDYLKAVGQYKKIIREGECSSEIYFNLANAYYKLDSIPQAILFYEKAKLLSPSDEDIEQNLKLANAKTIDKIEVIPQLFFMSWFQSFLNSFHTNTWAWFSIIASILSFTLFTYFFITKSKTFKKVAFYFGILMLIVCLGLIAITNSASVANKSKRAVVFAGSVTLKSEPNNAATSLFVIHEGAVCSIQEKVDDWVRVKLDNGNEGWLQQSEIQEI
jgi:tetratricopeptide (TPR) repeat protein